MTTKAMRLNNNIYGTIMRSVVLTVTITMSIVGTTKGFVPASSPYSYTLSFTKNNIKHIQESPVDHHYASTSLYISSSSSNNNNNDRGSKNSDDLAESIRRSNWKPPPGFKFAGVRSKHGSALGVGGAVMPDGGLSPCVIKVVGVGGGGSNAVDRMMDTRVQGVEFWAVNTDAQALGRSKAKGASVLNIGMTVTRGLGAGGNPEVGRMAAEESREEIHKMVEGSDLVFVTSGMGGGTGSGAAPVVAEIAKEEAGALTVGIVTKPFMFEGTRRMRQATEAIANLRENVDTVIVVSNNKLLEIIPDNTPLEASFAVADDILRQGVVGISEIIVRPGLINVDFADVRSVMQNAGSALMGIGTGSGKNGAEEAAAAAISSPLLDSPIDQATGVVFNIIGGPDLSLKQVDRAAKVIYKSVDAEANVIFGALIDDDITDDTVTMTVLATGFKGDGGVAGGGAGAGQASGNNNGRDGDGSRGPFGSIPDFLSEQ